MNRIHIVKQGEFLDRIAQRYGVSSQAIWDLDENSELKSRRPNWNMLAPGDLIHVPEGDDPEALGVNVGTTNRYRATIAKTRVSFIVREDDGPLKDERFAVEGLARVIEGKTTADGLVAFEVPLDVRQVRVVFGRLGRAYPIRIGDLDPIEELSGVHQRLRHLGYGGWVLGDVGTAALEARDDTDDGIKELQREHGLDQTGVVDEETLAALREEHRS